MIENKLDDFAKEAIPILRKYGYINTRATTVLKFAILIALTSGLLVFLYFLSAQINQEKFKSIDNSTCDNFNSNQCPSSNFTCSPKFECNCSTICYLNYTQINLNVNTS